MKIIKIKKKKGITHQGCCHMGYLGHLFEGVVLYGGRLDKIQRQALHCGKLDFVHPITKQPITVTAPIPDDMKNISREINAALENNIVL